METPATTLSSEQLTNTVITEEVPSLLRNNLKLFWLVILFAMFVFIPFDIYLVYNIKLGLDIALSDTFLLSLFFAALIYALPFSSRFIEFRKSQILLFIGTHICGAIIVCGLWTALHYYLFVRIFVPLNFWSFYSDTVLWRFFFCVLFYLIIQVFVYLLLFYDRSLEQAKQETTLKTLLTEAELKSLKFQINPHFIFNSLNSIAALTSIDPEQARKMTIMLADFLRSTLSNNLRQTVTLQEELHQLRLYAAIEKIRFGDKFSYTESVDESLLTLPIPNMLLQPLLENAIKYGVYEALEEIGIHLSVSRNENLLAITMENDFEDDASQLKQKGNGVGLANIQSRLSLLYRRDDLLTITKENSKFRVILTIPMDNIF
jgi:sensor histidine kinase YesM